MSTEICKQCFDLAFSTASNAPDVCHAAASNGHLECLRHAHENGYAWNEQTCHASAINGHLDCLKYAHQHGCALEEYLCSEIQDARCLIYAVKNGCCPWVKTWLEVAQDIGHADCYKIFYNLD